MDKIINVDLVAVLMCQMFVSKDPTREPIRYILLDGKYYTAIDGKRMIVYTHNHPDALPSNVLLKFSAGNIAEIRKMRTKKLFSAPLNLATQVMGVGENRIVVSGVAFNGDEINYPNWRNVMPKSKDIKPCEQMNISAKLLADYGDGISLNSTSEFGGIVVYPLVGSQWVGVIMPMRGDKKNHNVLDTL
jgi:hypothetical protein